MPSNGSYKVAVNGQTLAEGVGDASPDPAYTGPQFGVYNHGDNADPLQVTHLSYARCSYDTKPDFSAIQWLATPHRAGRGESGHESSKRKIAPRSSRTKNVPSM